MKKMIHSVLGTEYEILLGDRKQIDLDENNAGECRIYSKEIKVSTDKGDCVTDAEVEARVQEIVAHEIFHAYINEAGVDLGDDTEEMVASFFMKNWRKINNSILEVLDKNGFLDNY